LDTAFSSCVCGQLVEVAAGSLGCTANGIVCTVIQLDIGSESRMAGIRS
jgi:hypothetical protein